MPKIVKNKGNKIKTLQIMTPKFKDKEGRSRLLINMKDVFGFLPEILILDKVQGVSNQFKLSAVVPEQPKSKKKGTKKKNGDK